MKDHRVGWLRVLVVVLLAMTTVAALCIGAGRFVIFKLESNIRGEWSADPVSPSKARDVFGIEHLPAQVLQTQQREGGFHEKFFEALLRIAPGSEAAFLAQNGLGREETEPTSGAADQFEARIRAVASPKGEMRVTPLAGVRRALLADGGAIDEYRHALLLEFDDQLWLALEVFDD